jgi:16S rRNA G966 N2-methylase RsmD
MKTTSNVMVANKADFLFRFVPANVRLQLLFDDEALYSTTDQMTADKISQDILKFVPKTATITDATACIGGSSYSFSRIFQNTIAIEIDPCRYSHLIHNFNVLSQHGAINKVTCVYGDALDVCTRLEQSVIFIDPPWGGPEYKNKQHVSLYLSNIPLSQACIALIEYTKYIVLKVPTNFDEKTFIHDTSSVLKLIHKNVSLRKMHLLIVERI